MTPDPPVTAAMQPTRGSDVIAQFGAFFDDTVDAVFAHVLRHVRSEERANDIIQDVYFSLLQQRRFFWWRRHVMTDETVISLADKAIRSLGAWERRADGIAGVDRQAILSPARKAQIREAVLERFLAARLSNLRFVMPIAAFVVVSGGFIGSVLSVEPRSLGASLTAVAAAQVLMLEDGITSLDALAGTEADLRGIAAYRAQRSLAALTTELASIALRDHVREQREARSILDGMRLRPVLGATTTFASGEIPH